MQKVYEAPVLELVSMETGDVIMTSGGGDIGEGGGEDDGW